MSDKKTETRAVEPEAIYDAAEIAQNAQRLFGYNVDLATAAFDFGGVKSCTLAEAQKIIKEFAERKVD